MILSGPRDPGDPIPIIDVNAWLSRWPTRRLPHDDTMLLVQEFQRLGITQSWVSSFDAILHNDVAEVNRRLSEECQASGDGLLLPFGAINLSLPAWQDDVRRCVEIHGMRGVRLLPGYHGYALDDPRFQEMAELAEESGLILQISMRLEDPRTQHRMLMAKDVDLAPLPDTVKQHPRLRVVLLNALGGTNPELHAELVRRGSVFFDLSTLEGMEGVEKVLKVLPSERLLVGTHAPFFVAESAVLKLSESMIPAPMRAQISSENARTLLG